MPGSHRIVRIGEVQNCSILLAGRIEQAVEVRFVVDIRNSNQVSAITRNVVVEGWVAAQRVDDPVTFLNILSDYQPEQGVDTCSRHYVLRLYAVMCGNGMAQFIVFRIAILPDFARFGPNCIKDRRRWTKTAFIRADPCLERLSAL